MGRIIGRDGQRTAPSLFAELAWIIALKVIAIGLIWWFFFSEPPPVDPIARF